MRSILVLIIFVISFLSSSYGYAKSTPSLSQSVIDELQTLEDEECIYYCNEEIGEDYEDCYDFCDDKIKTIKHYNGEKNMIIMTLKYGNVEIELYDNKAPKHVERIMELTKEKFYDGIVFHRVIEGFMAQAGDPSGTGAGGSNKPNLKAEFNDIKHVRGIMSMARSADVNSANSQFFIMLGDLPHLDGQYTAFGKVVKGMEYIDQIHKGPDSNNGLVASPDKILKMRVIYNKTK